MARCEVCNLELDEVERYCPGCGVPAPRRVVDVSTCLRESFHGAAADDLDTEYAFGSKRVLKTAPPPPPVTRQRRSRTRKPFTQREIEDVEPVHAAEPVQNVPVGLLGSGAEPEPVPAAEIVEPPPSVFQEPAEVVEPVPDELVEPPPSALQEPDVSEIEVAEDIEGGEEQRATQEDEVPGEDSAAAAASVDVAPGAEDEPDAPAANVHEVADETTHVDDELPNADVQATLVRLAPALAESDRVTPYVVLPPRRAVAVREREAVVEVVPEPEVARPSRWKAAVLVFVLVVAVAGAAAYVLDARQQAPVGGPFTAEAQDGSISLDAPAGWRLEARGAGVLGIGEAAHDIHVHATAIRRSALGDGLSLKRRAGQVHEEFVASFDDADASRPATAKVGPYPAIRQVLSTSSVIYVHTVVKMPAYFVNVLAWTSAERFNEEQETLLGVVGTLQSSG